MSDYLEMTIASDLFDDYPIHNVLVLHTITIQDLIDEVRKEFNLTDESEYALALKGTRKELKPDASLTELSLGNGTDLVFGRRQRKQQQFKGTQIRTEKRAYLIAEDGTRYDISRSTALIGRALSDATTSVEINLAALDKTNSVSRQHARLIEANGNYLIEALREDNPTFLNDAILLKSEPTPIKSGDTIRVGRITLTFHIPT